MIAPREQTRLDVQKTLDAAKTQAERNKLGQFATPTALARDILLAAKELMPRESVRFLDPAFGTGSFYSALLSVFPAGQVGSARGFEIDAHYGEQAQTLWQGSRLDLALCDFTKVPFPAHDAQKANLIVCNPPYVRHHHMRPDDKLRLHELSHRAAGAKLSGLAGLYCHFLCISHAWLASHGLAFWLIPSEFMDVNYGSAVKDYLLSRVELLRIHRFNPAAVQFDDALVSSAVVVFRNAAPRPGHEVEFTYGGSLLVPETTRRVPASTLGSAKKWTGLAFEPAATNHSLRLADLFTIKRGIATGGNGFFVLPADKAAELAIPGRFLKPILPSPRYLDSDVIEADAAGNPLIERRLVLLDCALSEEQVRDEYPSLWKYLEAGEARGVRQGYLCQHRLPWYSQEQRPAAPFLCTYMGRKGDSGSAFRFILNKSRATCANVYLLLYPKPSLARAMAHDPALACAVWAALGRIAPESLIGAGRVYGGGLHKMEPRELAEAPADDVLAVLPQAAVPARVNTLFVVGG